MLAMLRREPLRTGGWDESTLIIAWVMDLEEIWAIYATEVEAFSTVHSTVGTALNDEAE